ncbi:unnamed protein product [Effrenium voratum]|nr:unnamed protein product [Effrenium voratum]
MAAADALAHANADAPLPRRPSPDEVLLAVQTPNAAAHYDHPQPHVRACLVALEQAFTNRASRPSQAQGDVGGWSYKLSRLLEALLAARLLKSADSLPDVLVRSVNFLMGAGSAEEIHRSIAQDALKVPSGATLSRARLRLDVALMLERQALFARMQQQLFVNLSADSSPQGGTDFQLTLEDLVERSRLRPGMGRRGGGGGDMSGVLTTTVLPVATLAALNTDLAAKFEATFSSIKLDVGLGNLRQYALSVIGFCSDFGTESGLADAPCLLPTRVLLLGF